MRQKPSTQIKAAQIKGHEARHADWFYDELMTAQPEAIREFSRARLAAQRPIQAQITPKKKAEPT